MHKDKLQQKCMILELQKSTAGKQDQVIKIRVASHELTGVCWRNLERYSQLIKKFQNKTPNHSNSRQYIYISSCSYTLAPHPHRQNI